MLYYIIIMALLLVSSGFFSGSETALFSLNRIQRRKLYNSQTKSGILIHSLLENPHRLLTTILLGNMFVNVLYTSISVIISLQLEHEKGQVWGFGTELASLSCLIIFGEVLPKTFAINYSEIWSKFCSFPMSVIKSTLFHLATFFMKMDIVSNKESSNEHIKFSPKELEFMVHESQNAGVIDSDESKMLTEVMKLSQKNVKEIMTPRIELTAFDLSNDREEFVRLVKEERHTKIPVYRKSSDNIQGIIPAKDALLNPEKPLIECIVPPSYIPETSTIESLLIKFRESGRHMQLVVDEFGNLTGVVTIEDVVEEIVGEIHDEFDDPEKETMEALGNNKYLLSGRLSVREWSAMYDISNNFRGIDTVGGLVTSLLGKIPKVKDVAIFSNLKFTVMKMNKRRVSKIMVELVEDKKEENK